LAELPTTPADAQRLLAQNADKLRLRAKKLRRAHEELSEQIENLRWRGYGATRWRHMIKKEMVQLDHCTTRMNHAAALLDGLADDAKQSAKAIERKEDEARAAVAGWKGGEAAFLQEVGLTSLPPEGDPKWAKLWKHVFVQNGNGTGGARAPD
jgi:hypothetical protein